DPGTRSQLLSTAKRLPARDGLPLVQAILERNIDAGDAHIPLLAWWAVEAHAIDARDRVLEMFGTAKAWDVPLVRNVLLERLMRRYAAEGGTAGLTACARLLAAAPSSGRGRLLAALDQGMQERPSRAGKSMGTLFSDFAAVDKAQGRSEIQK